ncbi:hypothetical protein B0H19DRAFT_1237159 [Mycena capillaripes]|nr:hypothetical protein B0H19DRAFT_1237159 [Mycena capillaripes]
MRAILVTHSMLALCGPTQEGNRDFSKPDSGFREQYCSETPRANPEHAPYETEWHAFQQLEALELDIKTNITARVLLPYEFCSGFKPDSKIARILESISVSAAGVGADGWTTYVEVEVITSVVLEAPSTTTTLISTPYTESGSLLLFPLIFEQTLTRFGPPLAVTFEENASGYRESFPITGVGATLYQSCGFGGDGRGTCVQHQVIQSTQEVAFETFSGNVAPFYTLVSSPSSGLPTRIYGGHIGSAAFLMTLVVGALLHTL